MRENKCPISPAAEDDARLVTLMILSPSLSTHTLLLRKGGEKKLRHRLFSRQKSAREKERFGCQYCAITISSLLPDAYVPKKGERENVPPDAGADLILMK